MKNISNNENIYPEIFSNEFIVNVENVRLTLITQEAATYNYKIPKGVVMHFHMGYEMFLCEKGEIYISVGDQKLTFKEGEALIVPPKMSHALSGHSSGSMQNSLYFSIAPNKQKSSFDLYRIISKIIGDSYTIIPGMGEMAEIMKSFRMAAETRNLYEISLLAHKFLMKMVELTGNIPKNHESTFSDNPNLRVHNIHMFIHRRLGETVSIEELASVLRLSSRQTSRIIKDNFGCSFKDLVTKIRMEKAGELMLQTKCKVSEIAEMVGYSSERGFYTAFKNHYGCLPKEYRRKNIE